MYVPRDASPGLGSSARPIRGSRRLASNQSTSINFDRSVPSQPVILFHQRRARRHCVCCCCFCFALHFSEASEPTCLSEDRLAQFSSACRLRPRQTHGRAGGALRAACKRANEAVGSPNRGEWKKGPDEEGPIEATMAVVRALAGRSRPFKSGGRLIQLRGRSAARFQIAQVTNSLMLRHHVRPPRRPPFPFHSLGLLAWLSSSSSL